MSTHGQRKFRQAAKALREAAKQYEATGRALVVTAKEWVRDLDEAALLKATARERALVRAALAHAEARQRLEQCLGSAPLRRRVGSRSPRSALRSDA